MKSAYLAAACLVAIGLSALTAQRLVTAPTLRADTTRMSAVATGSAQGQTVPDSQTFMGRIAKSSDGTFILQDTASDATFLLDDQEKAKKFDGKIVKVTGMLDASNRVIHVVEIKEA
jgi:hypothetical protein